MNLSSMFSTAPKIGQAQQQRLTQAARELGDQLSELKCARATPKDGAPMSSLIGKVVQVKLAHNLPDNIRECGRWVSNLRERGISKSPLVDGNLHHSACGILVENIHQVGSSWAIVGRALSVIGPVGPSVRGLFSQVRNGEDLGKTFMKAAPRRVKDESLLCCAEDTVWIHQLSCIELSTFPNAHLSSRNALTTVYASLNDVALDAGARPHAIKGPLSLNISTPLVLASVGLIALRALVFPALVSDDTLETDEPVKYPPTPALVKKSDSIAPRKDAVAKGAEDSQQKKHEASILPATGNTTIAAAQPKATGQATPQMPDAVAVSPPPPAIPKVPKASVIPQKEPKPSIAVSPPTPTTAAIKPSAPEAKGPQAKTEKSSYTRKAFVGLDEASLRHIILNARSQVFEAEVRARLELTPWRLPQLRQFRFLRPPEAKKQIQFMLDHLRKSPSHVQGGLPVEAGALLEAWREIPR